MRFEPPRAVSLALLLCGALGATTLLARVSAGTTERFARAVSPPGGSVPGPIFVAPQRALEHHEFYFTRAIYSSGGRGFYGGWGPRRQLGDRLSQGRPPVHGRPQAPDRHRCVRPRERGQPRRLQHPTLSLPLRARGRQDEPDRGGGGRAPELSGSRRLPGHRRFLGPPAVGQLRAPDLARAPGAPHLRAAQGPSALQQRLRRHGDHPGSQRRQRTGTRALRHSNTTRGTARRFPTCSVSTTTAAS